MFPMNKKTSASILVEELASGNWFQILVCAPLSYVHHKPSWDYLSKTNFQTSTLSSDSVL